MDLLEIVQQKLGWSLRAADRSSIDDLNRVPARLIEAARALDSPLLADALLGYFIVPELRGFLKAYTRDVVFGGAAPETWRRGRILVPALSLEEQLVWSPAELLAPIGGTCEARTVPRFLDWQAGVAWVGAPARVQSEATYLSPLPEHATSLVISATEPVAEWEIALARWIAGRLARVLRDSGRLHTANGIAELAAGLGPVDRWSAVARTAARALLREYRELGSPQDEVPGFRGPDEWYRS